MNQLLRIGEFAKLGQVSIKTLRFYEAEGLLKPEYVNPETGYRYYRMPQSEQLALITNLRAGGFHISEISALLKSDISSKQLADSISAKREKLLDERAAIDDRLRIVETLSKSVASQSEQSLSMVKLKSVSPQRVHSVSKRVPCLGTAVTKMFESAESEVAARNARAASAPFLIFHDAPSKRRNLRVEVCIPVTDKSCEHIESTVIPGCELACTVAYRGSYEQTAILRDRMGTWIENAGLTSGGPLREIYHRFGADQEDYKLPSNVLAKGSNEYLTEILMPLQVST